MPPARKLTVAVTGLTGTIGHGLLPFLEGDERIRRVVGIGSRPAPGGLSPGVEYVRADVRDRYAIAAAVQGADVVVHLAFSLYGLRQGPEELERINVEGSRNVLAGAAQAGARRFIYTSSAAVYGFGGDRATRVDEDAPVRDQRHFYAAHKVAVERALLRDLEELPGMEWVFFRPCAVVGPHAGGAAGHGLRGPLARLAGAAMTVAGSAGLRPAVPGPPVPLQFVHERDAGQAIHRAIHSKRTGAIYNLAGDGMVAAADVPRTVGLRTLPLPNAVTRAAFAAAARLPYALPALGWAQLLAQPLELDTRRARRELRWRPEFSSREALAATRRALAI